MQLTVHGRSNRATVSNWRRRETAGLGIVSDATRKDSVVNFEFRAASVCTLHFAIILSDLRESWVLTVADWLGALYLANLESVSKYWTDPGGFRRLIMSDAQLSRLISVVQEKGIQEKGITSPFGPEGRASSGGIHKDLSADFHKVLKTARTLAAHHRGGSQSSRIPLFPEDFLLSIATHTELDLGLSLAQSGLDMAKLTEAVRTLSLA